MQAPDLGSHNTAIGISNFWYQCMTDVVWSTSKYLTNPLSSCPTFAIIFCILADLSVMVHLYRFALFAADNKHQPPNDNFQ